METYKFHVQGMHCKACIALTEGELCTLPEIQTVKASLDDLSVEINGNFGNKDKEQIASQLTELLKPHGCNVTGAHGRDCDCQDA